MLVSNHEFIELEPEERLEIKVAPFVTQQIYLSILPLYHP